MVDTTKKPTEGFFKIEQFDKDNNLIDSYEDQNMIMRDSKRSVAYLTNGAYPDAVNNMYINAFVLGNKGSVEGDLLTPKSFSFERTGLFAQSTTGGVTYPIVWNPKLDPNQNPITASTASKYVVSEGSTVLPSVTNDSTVDITIEDDSTIVYVINISNANANGSGEGAIAWTEAGLFTAEGTNDTSGIGGKIFAMRTFPAKIKENTTNFRITWKIVF